MMYSATVYVEIENGIKKLSSSFEDKRLRDEWLISVLMRYDFSYCVINGEEHIVNNDGSRF